MPEPFDFPSWEAEKWAELPENPLIAPVTGRTPRSVIGDPQVILPGEFDERWHLFVIGRGHFYRFDSNDGVRWDLAYDLEWRSGPACVTCDGKRWIAYYTHSLREPEPRCTISARTSEDLVHWSAPVEILAPEQDWEREGKRIQVRNPNLVLLPDGRPRLYYSGGTVWMDDMGFEEPKYISFAEAQEPLGPFRKHGKPVLAPDSTLWYRNHGAGAIKVYRYGENFLALANGIYLDREGHSRSAIEVLLSADGIGWTEAPYGPIVTPSKGWKKALVYQLDLRCYRDRLWLFYNARDGWREGVEWIGCSTLPWTGSKPEKLWRLR